MQSTDRPFDPPLFRGIGNAHWGLETTLERAYPSEIKSRLLGFAAYHAFAQAARSAIESLSGTNFGEEFLTYTELQDRILQASDFPPIHAVNTYLHGNLSRYLVYLRHHGYPSPLLDWTASPYFAAFFAFDRIDLLADRVGIYCIIRDSLQAGSWDNAEIITLGRHIRTHRRHTLQQSSYTLCLDRESIFHRHDDVMNRKGSLGVLGQAFLITVPVKQRRTALKMLDSMNVNEYSLFGSEDSLVRTIARRENLFHDY